MWASTAYLGDSGASAFVAENYRNPAQELEYARSHLANAGIALDALSDLYDGGETKRQYEDAEYEAIYDKYSASFGRLLTSLKTEAELNKAIAKESAQNQRLYNSYSEVLAKFTGFVDTDFSKPENREDYSIANFLTVKDGRLCFNSAPGSAIDNNWKVNLAGANDISALDAYFEREQAEKSTHETNPVSDFELMVRDLIAKLSEDFEGIDGTDKLLMAREYMLRKLAENNRGDSFAETDISLYERDGEVTDGSTNLGKMVIRSDGSFTGEKVDEKGRLYYDMVETEQEQIWNGLSEEQKKDVESFTALTLLGGTLDGFDLTKTKVYNSLYEMA
jgi:hypothetical protein